MEHNSELTIDKLSNTNKGWKDDIFTVVDDLDIPSLYIPPTPT